MSYLDRLKDRFPENCPTEVLIKLTEAPFVSSVSTPVGQKKASDALSQQDPDPALPYVSPELAARENCPTEALTKPTEESGVSSEAAASRRHGLQDNLELKRCADTLAILGAPSAQDWGAMTTAALLQAAEAAGMAIRVDGDALAWEVYSGCPPGLGDAIRARKAEIMARVHATGLHRGAPWGDAARERDLPGISPELKARLSAEDLKDIKAGDISLDTVQAFEAAAIARETEDLKEFFEEHAAILEYDTGLPRTEAEFEAAKIAATVAKRYGYGWASLYEALNGYPVLQPLLSDEADEVKP